MTQFHDFHHAKFGVNFGVVGFLDRYHNTDQGFRAYLDERNNDQHRNGVHGIHYPTTNPLDGLGARSPDGDLVLNSDRRLK